MLSKVSIVMTSYNHAPFIAQAIESVRNQTYLQWELIIVDDASTDNSATIIEKYCKKDVRISSYQHPHNRNKGLAASILLGLDNAQGEYIAFLESDDIWEPTSLAEKVAIFKKHKDTVLVFSATKMIGSKAIAKTKKNYYDKCRELFVKKNCTLHGVQYFLELNPIATFSCVMCTRKSLQRITMPTEKALQVWTDLWLWGQLSLKGTIRYVDKPLTQWRLHNKSYNSAHHPFSHTQVFREKFWKRYLAMLLTKSYSKPTQYLKILYHNFCRVRSHNR